MTIDFEKTKNLHENKNRNSWVTAQNIMAKAYNLIEKDMTPMSGESKQSITRHVSDILANGDDVKGVCIVTNNISLILSITHGTDSDYYYAFAYYPITDVSSFVADEKVDEGTDAEYIDFADRAYEKLLKSHNWHNEEVEKALMHRQEAKENQKIAEQIFDDIIMGGQKL